MDYSEFQKIYYYTVSDLTITELQFRQCSNCGQSRSWGKELCPTCGNESFVTTVQNGSELVERAAGRNISESVLFTSDVRLRDVNSRLNGIMPERLRSGVGSRLPDQLISQFKYEVQLEYRLSDYLRPDEQPEFVLYFYEPLREYDGDEIHKIESTAGPSTFTSFVYNPSHSNTLRIGGLLVITDSRLLILVEQDQGTVTRSIKYDDINDIDREPAFGRTIIDKIRSKINISPMISVRGATRNYELRGCEPSSEVSPVVGYVSAQIRGEEFDAEAAYADSETIGDQVDSIVDQIDFKRVGSLAARGGTVGRTPKQKATGAVLGGAYGIYASMTDEGPKDAGEPSADDIGAAAAEWQQAGADTDDKRAEWFGAALGVSLQIAAGRSDSDMISLVQDIDPQTTTQLIQRSIKAVDSQSNLQTRSQEFESSLPESVQTWQSVIAGLLEEGLLDELQAAYEEYTYDESV